MECVSALHHNKRKTNYHIHLIFSERELLPEPIEKIATHNMFYNEQKKHVRTKKEILDDSGNVRKGCKIIEKGEVYERTIFTARNKLFKQEHYLDEAKRFYTDLNNVAIKSPTGNRVIATISKYIVARKNLFREEIGVRSDPHRSQRSRTVVSEMDRRIPPGGTSGRTRFMQKERSKARPQ